MENNNVQSFAMELSKLVGQPISTDHIHPCATGRYYYTQAPKDGAPMILNHYRGPFCVDISPADFRAISSGNVSAHDYITSANWQVGYYWGGGSMLRGGYYQPVDIVNRSEEVRRYLKILSCRGFYRACGYMPSEAKCAQCVVENCPFSRYKEGNWEAELPEVDPRVVLFRSLRTRFEDENPGYTLHGFLCGGIPENEIWIKPSGRYTLEEPFAFMAYASNTVIQSLLMRETEPEKWANCVEFRIHKMFEDQVDLNVTKESLEKVSEELDYTKKVNTRPEDVDEERVPLAVRVGTFCKKIF